METFIGIGVLAVCVGLAYFLADELSSILKAFADAKVKASQNMLEIEREKTKQEERKSERARLEFNKLRT